MLWALSPEKCIVVNFEMIGAVFRTVKSIQGPCTNMIFLDFSLRMRNFLTLIKRLLMVLKTFLAAHILLFQTFANSDAETVGRPFCKNLPEVFTEPSSNLCVSSGANLPRASVHPSLSAFFSFLGIRNVRMCQNRPIAVKEDLCSGALHWSCCCS